MTDREFMWAHLAKLRSLRDRGRVTDAEMVALVLDVTKQMAHTSPRRMTPDEVLAEDCRRALADPQHRAKVGTRGCGDSGCPVCRPVGIDPLPSANPR